ncbi:hypothetical protein [Streptomyces sp. NBC_00154]|uniref:hypothetical protein n=1 Tax=Streptomyces sp. NBC_00154 TaxID=2975670 RepID=UPI002B1E83B2|nr:hypothetical protein [Streptomyces sp. NBC_00154]
MGVEPKLAYTSSQLRKLASDLDDMQEHLGEQVKRMDEIVDGIETGWRGPLPRPIDRSTVAQRRMQSASGRTSNSWRRPFV